MAKVMVFTPTWATADGGLAMRPETRAAVLGLEFEGETVWEIGLHNPYPYETHQNVLAQYERAAGLLLASDCEALLTVEHDMRPPADGLQKLWDTGAEVAYGAYLLRHGSLVLNTFEFIGGRNLGESLTIHPAKLAAARRAGTVRVSGAGFGFTLMRRAVVERFGFHAGGGDQWCPDIPLAVDCLIGDVVSVARMDVACGHYDQGRWLWPYGGGREMRVKALETVNVADSRGVMHLEAGQEYELDGSILSDLIRAGYVQVMEEPPAPEERVLVVANETMTVAVVTKTMHLVGGEEYLLPRDVAGEMQRAGYVRVVGEELSIGPADAEWTIIEAGNERAVAPQAAKARPRKGKGRQAL